MTPGLNSALPPDVFLSDTPDKFRRALRSWFADNQRRLPWRTRRTLYGTWVSEMMLQQTTVGVVVPFWEKFMAAFPDVASLAAADLAEVLSLWAGLGYYRRARQLHQAARFIVTDLQGALPVDFEGWLALPGIGPYAAGAIASIGLDIPVPALDANARRVFTRWMVADPESQTGLKPTHLDKVAASLVDEKHPGDWNEAVMELGALICRAAEPRCSSCPVSGRCRAHLAGVTDLVPPPKTAAATQGVQLGLLVLLWQDRVLLLPPGCRAVVTPAGFPPPVREDVSGLHGGLWGLPATPWLPLPSGGPVRWSGEIWRTWLSDIPELQYSPGQGDPVLLGDFRHAVTRYRLVVQVYALRVDARLPLAGGMSLVSEGSRAAVGKAAEGKAPGGPGRETSHGRAGFYGIPSPNHPLSNLVSKGLSLAADSSV